MSDNADTPDNIADRILWAADWLDKIDIILARVAVVDSDGVETFPFTDPRCEVQTQMREDAETVRQWQELIDDDLNWDGG